MTRLLMIAAIPITVDRGLLDAQDNAPPPIVVSDQALEIHRSAPVIDGHNDLPWGLRMSGRGLEQYDLNKAMPRFHTDIPRLRAGGVGAQFWSVYVPASTIDSGTALNTTLEQIELVKAMCEQYPDVFEIALTSEDVARIRKSGKIASMCGVEGGHSIENSLNALRQLYEAGARYMTLTHSRSLDWADSCTDQSISGGLSPFGEEVVAEMNRLGMLVDISHVSADCMRHVLRVTEAPVIFSHSSARGVANHPRNVPDDVLRSTKENGGVVMINFFTDYVNPQLADRSRQRAEKRIEFQQQFPDDRRASNAALRRWEVGNPRSGVSTIHDVLDHIDHVVKVAGIDHVGLGSDFDGVPMLPTQLEDVSTYPAITQGLLDRGYNESDIRKILGENVMRVFQQTEQVARAKS